MTTPTLGTLSMESLEEQLKQQRAAHQRLVIIDHLVEQYVYTDVKRARELLSEQFELIRKHPYPDFEVNYFLYTAQVENLLYQYESAEVNLSKAIDLLQASGDVKELVDVYVDYAGTLINLRRLGEAEDYLQKAGKLLKSFPDERLTARIICRQGYINLHHTDYSRAIELLMEADKRLTDTEHLLGLKDYYFLMFIHSGLGMVHERNDDLEKSVRAHLKVVEMAEATNIRNRLSWQYLNVGNAYMAMNKLEQAEVYFLKTFEINDDLNPFTRASSLANLGYCQYQQKNYPKALDLLKKAESLFGALKNEEYQINLSHIEEWRALVYIQLNKRDAAHEHFSRALELARDIENFKQIANVCKEIATYYAGEKDYKAAYEYQLLHNQYLEMHIQQVNEQRQWELEAKYEAEKKRREAEVLELKATSLQLKALRAQMNPHFLYNALNSIQNYITSNEMASAAKFLAKFAKLMRQSLEYSELEIISLEKEIEFMEDYLYINEKLRYEDNLRYLIEVDEEIEEDIIGVPTMIIQPYVENALEHGLRAKENGLIRLSFSPWDENNILCVVEDNGIGREQAKKYQIADERYSNHRSRGTSITEQRLRLLHNAKIKTEDFVNIIDLKDAQTGKPAGTKVEIRIPIMDIPLKQGG